MGATASDREGCLEVPSGLALFSGFDDNLIIEFTLLILYSPKVQSLDFLDQSKTPQSRILQLGSTSKVADPVNQG